VFYIEILPIVYHQIKLIDLFQLILKIFKKDILEVILMISMYVSTKFEMRKGKEYLLRNYIEQHKERHKKQQ
jgi:hypothetical protein